jgi:two-component system CheB/CheR fusion protein
MGSYGEYREHLCAHADEFAILFNTILINVTSFFRDPQAWEYLAAEVIPLLLHAKQGGPVRVWSAGCASGEEAYTIAMVLAQAMGTAAFCSRVKVYATDADEHALNQARLASYSARDLEAVAPELRERYFHPVNERYHFSADLRRCVIFGLHDLVQDAPISHLDLLICRNTIMYFNAETQRRIMSRFHFALNGNGEGEGGGYLFLGRAEMMLTQSQLFAPLDLRNRVFAKVPLSGLRKRPAAPQAAPVNGEGAMDNDKLRELAMEELPVARVVIDADGTLMQANQRARALFSLNPRDVGRALQDLEISHRPVELRALIEQAYAERRPATKMAVERRFPTGEAQYLDIVVAPLFNASDIPAGVGITFIDVTRYQRISEELQQSREEIQTTAEELQSSNEELETTNEELQSSNEELETTNEELQSTNEELETMNEELQSTNEELQTVNEELRRRTQDLNQSHAFLESVLSSLGSGAVVVNKNLDVLMWNARAYDLWGLRGDEVKGKSLLNLDIGLPVAELRGVIRPCLSGEAELQEVVLNAINRRGKSIKCRISCTPLRMGSDQREGVIIMMEEV